MAAAVHTTTPLLPVDISQSPLLSGSLLPDELFTTLAGPLPTITIGPCPPASPRLEARHLGSSRFPRAKNQHNVNLLSKLTLPGLTPSTPSSPHSVRTPRTPPGQVASLLDLLASMEKDVATEVQRVRLGIQETRMLVQACREDCAARETARRRKLEMKTREM